ncbi:MAG: ribosome small subunit-dependent GTPase A [Rhodobacterales bacterium]|nr:ribosome small subunit-dependent GTPase A [Rhodobacterales bacterium]
MARRPPKTKEDRSLPGRVVETRGRRVLVADKDGERVCFLSGQRAVVGDEVRWVEAQGTGGKLVGVNKRRTALIRVDQRGKEQVLVANLAGLLVVAAPLSPPFRAGLLDRYWVGGSALDLRVVLCLNKIDEPIPEAVEVDLALRVAAGLRVLQVSAHSGQGMAELESFIDTNADEGPWALVGHSGVGKTSIIASLLPKTDVGEVGELSAYWGTGQHTTTHSRIFPVGRGEVVDSPGIRTFAPGRLAAEDVRRYFPGVQDVRCHYRDCLHRDGEEGCGAPEAVPQALLLSYRKLQEELAEIERRQRL